MHKPNTPLLAVLILGLLAALYFVFTPPVDSHAADLSGTALAEEVENDTQDTDADALAAAEEVAVTREDAESLSEPAAVVSLIQTRVQVLDPDGSGVEGARVLHWLGSRLQPEVLTNKEGEVTLESQEGEGGYAVMAPGYLAVHSIHVFDGDPIYVHLPVGQIVAGKVTFVRLSSFQEDFEMALFSLPQRELEGAHEFVNNAFWGMEAKLDSAVVNLDANGSFRISGLPAKWEGNLTVPYGFFITALEGGGVIQGQRRIRLLQASSNLLIELIEAPSFTGRVVSPDGSVGVANVAVTLSLYLEENNFGAVRMDAKTDADGYFRALVYPNAEEKKQLWRENPTALRPFKAVVTVGNADIWAGGEFTLDLINKANPWELGDFAMKEPVLIDFRAVDTVGKPIEGAIAYASELSEPTDADGFGQVVLSEEPQEIRVSARGFDSDSHIVTASQQGFVEFVLPQAVRLHISLTAAADVDLSQAHLRINSDEHVYASGDGIMDLREGKLQKALGLPTNGGRRSGSTGKSSSDFWLRAGVMELGVWGLKPGIPMKVEMVGKMSGVIASSEEMVFAPGEQRDVQLYIPHGGRNFHGTVVDRSGAPLAGVEVDVSNPEGSGTILRTLADGKFQLEGIAWPFLDVEVRKAGYATWLDEEFPISQYDEAVEIVLDEARDLVLFFHDASGKRYSAGQLFKEGKELEAQWLDSDGFQINGVPHTSFPLAWKIGGAKGETWVPEEVAEFGIEIPVMASAVVRIHRTNSAELEFVGVSFMPEGSDLYSEEPSIITRSFRVLASETLKEGAFATLLPGRYSVRYSIWRGDGVWAWKHQSIQGPIEVLPGQLLELDLEF